MSYDSEATEVDNDSGKGPGKKDPRSPSPPTLNNSVPQDDVNDSGEDSGKKDPRSEIHLDSDDNSYDSKYLKNLNDQINRNESIAAKDPI